MAPFYPSGVSARRQIRSDPTAESGENAAHEFVQFASAAPACAFGRFGCRPPPRCDRCAGPPARDAGLPAIPEGQPGEPRRGQARRADRRVEGRQVVRVHARRQAVSLRRRARRRRRKSAAAPAAEPAGGRGAGGRGGGPARGRQFESAESPDKKFRAVYRDRNLYMVDVATNAEVAVTTDGSEKDRTKNGTGSWVYGEELGQRTAMWWSPDSSKLAYYRFDESKVPDYYLQLKQTQLQSDVDTEAYPKAGADNPIVELFVYDVATKKSTTRRRADRQAVRQRRRRSLRLPRLVVAATARELLFNRTNRRQNILEFAAADPDTGATRVIVREEWPTGWVENSPAITLLKDGKRFIWESERNGWTNFYLYDLVRQADHPADDAHDVRGRRTDQARRAGERALLHGAERRQPSEDAAASRRPRRQEGRPADRPGLPPHDRRLHERPGGGASRGAARPPRARAASRRTTGTSSTSIRRTTRRRRRASSTPRGKGRCGARAERPDEVHRARAQEGGDVHLQGR